MEICCTIVLSQQNMMCSGSDVGWVELALAIVDTEKPSGTVTTVDGEEIFINKANASSWVSSSGKEGQDANSAGVKVKNLILLKAGPITFLRFSCLFAAIPAIKETVCLI